MNTSRDWFSTWNNPYPASGYRPGYSGGLLYVGAYGYFWSSAPHSASSMNGSNLFFVSSNVTPEGNYQRALGFPVRCVQE